jgi:hypothetical protein
MVLEKKEVCVHFSKDHASTIILSAPDVGVYNKVFYRHTT